MSVKDVRRWLSSSSCFDKPKVAMVYAHEAELVGFTVNSLFKAFDEKYTGLIDTLAIEPKFQGKGLGKKLLALTLNSLANKTNRIILYVNEDNYRAIKLFSKMEFRVYRRLVRFDTSINHLLSLL